MDLWLARFILLPAFSLWGLAYGRKVRLFGHNEGMPRPLRIRRRIVSLLLVITAFLWFVSGLIFISLDTPGYGGAPHVEKVFWICPVTIPRSPWHVRAAVVGTFAGLSAIFILLCHVLLRMDCPMPDAEGTAKLPDS
jgi:hypothetical protein